MRISMIGQKGAWSKTPGGGGIERHVEELSLRLARTGHEVTVYVRSSYAAHVSFPVDMPRSLRIVSVPSIRTKNLDAISYTFLATVHALFTRQDIVHFHGVGPSLLSWMPRIFRPGAFVIATFHSIDRTMEKWGMFARLMLTLGEWAACKFPHSTITTSRSLKRYCAKRYGVKTAYIPNGTTVTEHTPSRTSLKFAGRDYILAVSRLIPDKGIHLLVDAYREIEKRRLPKRAMPALVIVGHAPENDPYAKLLRSRAQGSKRIMFTGYKTGVELQAIYRHARLFVNPSFAEGFSTVVVEAQGHGVPVLASDIPGNREALSIHGYTFRAGDAVDLLRKLKSLMNMSPTALKARGKQSRAEVKERYDWDLLVGKVEAVYQSAIAA